MSLLKYQALRIKLGKILDKLYIPDNVCLSCNNHFKPSLQGYVCDDCIKSLKPSFFEKSQIDYIDSYNIFSDYEGALKELIIALKFKHVSFVADLLADIIREDFYRYLDKTRPDLITFVPISFLRFWQRGYNQNKLILKALKVENLELLKRIKHSKPLALIKDKQKRYQIVSKAFDVKAQYKYFLDDKKILVFDDILTTGATASSIAKLLKYLDAKEVYFYFLSSHRKSIDIDTNI